MVFGDYSILGFQRISSDDENVGELAGLDRTGLALYAEYRRVGFGERDDRPHRPHGLRLVSHGAGREDGVAARQVRAAADGHAHFQCVSNGIVSLLAYGDEFIVGGK